MELSGAQCITPPESMANSRSTSSNSVVHMATQDACSPGPDSSRKSLEGTAIAGEMGDTAESKESRAQAGDEEQEEHDGESAVASKSRKRKSPAEPIDDTHSDCERMWPTGDGELSTLEKDALGRRYFHNDTGLPQRRAKAIRRFMQAKAYAELVEDRIQDLEKKIQALTNDKTPLVHEKISPSDPAQPLLQVLPMRWIEFHSRAAFNFNPKTYQGEWQHRPETDDQRRPIIEVLTEEPRHSAALTELSTTRRPGRPATTTAEGRSTSGTPVPAREPYQIRIRSNPLLKLLKEITGCAVLVGPHEHRLLMVRPFKLLARFATRIKKHAEDVAAKDVTRPQTELQSDEVLKQLGELVTMMDQFLSRPLSLQQGIGRHVKRVSFNELWYLFKPGDEVRTPGEHQIQLYRIAKVTGGRDIPPEREGDRSMPDYEPTHASKKLKDQGYSEGAFVIECFYIHYDSTRFGPVNATFQIRKFDGERDICQLPVVPLKCYDKEQEIRDGLLARGQKFIALANPAGVAGKRAHRKYVGLTLDKNPDQVDSEVIVDFELAFMQSKIDKPALGLQDRLVSDDHREFRDDSKLMHPMCDRPGCCGNDAIFRDYEVDELERNGFRNENRALFDANYEDPKDLDLLHIRLLPPHVFGFVLRTRRWATFDITKLQEIPHNEEGWENLVIERSIKRTVLSLVKSHERLLESADPTRATADLTPGKGIGLIILLHGEPGVGKTSTAECVAALTGRPLFPVTCGDIGDKAETVETNLEKNFQLAHKWGCVLLLDEADIFLSARTESDIQRNAIVSVFLRTLEYYSGILFLTTNRVGTIDRAFKSRIHCSLLYKKLDLKRTMTIWKKNIARLSEKLPIQVDEKGILKFAEKHYKKLKRSEDLIVWNGRQIRNAFQTSIALATYDNEAQNDNYNNGDAKSSPPAVILNASHFERVAKDAQQFDKYLRAASSYTDSQRALEAKEREDEYKSSEGEDELDGPSNNNHKRKQGGKKRSESNKRTGSKKGEHRGKRKRGKSLSPTDEDSDSEMGSGDDDDDHRDLESGTSLDDARSSGSSVDDSEHEKARRKAKRKKIQYIRT